MDILLVDKSECVEDTAGRTDGCGISVLSMAHSGLLLLITDDAGMEFDGDKKVTEVGRNESSVHPTSDVWKGIGCAERRRESTVHYLHVGHASPGFYQIDHNTSPS